MFKRYRSHKASRLMQIVDKYIVVKSKKCAKGSLFVKLTRICLYQILGKPATPPKKLVMNGRVGSTGGINRAQSMRSPRSPSPQTSPDQIDSFATKFGTVRNLSSVIDKSLTQQRARPALNGRPTAPPPSVPPQQAPPPPPPSKVAAVKPPNHAPPPPPTNAIPQPPSHAPPPPPHRTQPQVPTRAPPAVSHS